MIKHIKTPGCKPRISLPTLKLHWVEIYCANLNLSGWIIILLNILSLMAIVYHLFCNERLWTAIWYDLFDDSDTKMYISLAPFNSSFVLAYLDQLTRHKIKVHSDRWSGIISKGGLIGSFVKLGSSKSWTSRGAWNRTRIFLCAMFLGIP